MSDKQDVMKYGYVANDESNMTSLSLNNQHFILRSPPPHTARDYQGSHCSQNISNYRKLANQSRNQETHRHTAQTKDANECQELASRDVK